MPDELTWRIRDLQAEALRPVPPPPPMREPRWADLEAATAELLAWERAHRT